MTTRPSSDKSSKWLIERHGNAILYLGGARGVRSWTAVQPELVQPSKLPDGLVRATLAGEKGPHYFLLEIATYAEKRVPEQVFGDLILSYQHLKTLPEVLVLVLRPKGQYRVEGQRGARSKLGWAKLVGGWKVVELWTVPAEELLAAGDVGLVPWAALAQFEGQPESLLKRCRERIEELAPVAEQDTLLAVTQVLASLRYPRELVATLAGGKVMIESPLIKELVAETRRTSILEVLGARFGDVPEEIAAKLGTLRKEKKLAELNQYAATCPSLKAFRDRLHS
jgi:hypothetical protein